MPQELHSQRMHFGSQCPLLFPHRGQDQPIFSRRASRYCSQLTSSSNCRRMSDAPPRTLGIEINDAIPISAPMSRTNWAPLSRFERIDLTEHIADETLRREVFRQFQQGNSAATSVDNAAQRISSEPAADIAVARMFGRQQQREQQADSANSYANVPPGSFHFVASNTTLPSRE